ncbi:MAG: DUF4288 domain-containing protein [Gemmataceae bacterium]|nr:DUF4288 domain-containing protein [Gemmataceae bacterium]
MKRFAAKLLFQFRVIVDGDSGKRRLCEERIISLDAKSARKALSLAKRRGHKGQYRYKNSDGNPVHFEFVGVMELLCLGAECAEDEVWYDMVEHLLPMERKERLVPPESDLSALRHSE